MNGTKLVCTPQTTLKEMLEMARKARFQEIARVLPLEQGAYEVDVQ